MISGCYGNGSDDCKWCPVMETADCGDQQRQLWLSKVVVSCEWWIVGSGS